MKPKNRKVVSSIKILLSPSEVQDFRWFLERCVEMGVSIKNDFSDMVRLDTIFTTESFVHKRLLNVPLMVLTELYKRLLPNLLSLDGKAHSKSITLKKSEALAVEFFIQNRPMGYLPNRNYFITVQTIWLLQVGKYL